MTRRAWILMLVLAALWGSSYMFIKIGLDDLSPGGIVFVRTVLAALVLLPIALHRDAFRGIRPLLGLLAVLAAVQVAAPFLLISYGEEHISSGLAGVLVASAPIFTALLAPFLDTAERSSGTALGGIAIGIVGVALILGVDLEGAALGGGDKPNPDVITPDHLRRVPQPTLVLWTSDNPGTSWQEAEGAAGLLPHGQFHLLADCAHWPQYEQAETYNRLTARFLRGEPIH